MSTTTVKIQLPINKTLRDNLAIRADELGFDSIQALLRYMAKAVADNREVTFGDQPWPQPSDKVAARLQTDAKQARADAKAGKLKAYTSVEDFMKDL